MKLIVGLGNPGSEYIGTRHNVGFEVLDALARRFAPAAVARSKFSGAVIEAEMEGERVHLLKPGAYMNLSGRSVAEAARFYKLDVTNDVLVIVDDTALPCGAIRLRAGGGAGGHNGLIDVEQHLASNVFARLRIGVDAPGSIPHKSYVLGRFRPDQLELIATALEEAVNAALCWVMHGIVETMNRFNHRSTA